MNEKKKQRKPKQNYVHRSPAVSVTVHDPSGRPMPQGLADELADAVWAIAQEHGYLINIARH